MVGSIGRPRTITADKETRKSSRPGRCYHCETVLGNNRIVVVYHGVDENGRRVKLNQRRYCSNVCLTALWSIFPDDTRPWWKRWFNIY